MQEQEHRAFLIAAGGTAGHVLPALAVAEALRGRGARVTFAGSPDRAEARLVPEAGYELDTFRVSGLPRRPGLAQARARAARARARRAACERILARRRPDVVLGGGGYVAGPMVVAAARRRIPAALTEADAHLGLANRLAAPFARRVFLSYPIAGPRAAEVPRHRPADPRNARARCRATRLARSFGLPAEGPVLLVAGARAGRARAERAGGRGVRQRGPGRAARRGRARLRARSAGASRGPTTGCCRCIDGLGAALGAADLALIARRRRRSGSSRPPGCPRSSFPTRSRPPTTRRRTRATSSAAAARSWSPRASSGRVPETRPLAARRPASGSSEMSAAMRASRGPTRPSEIAEELIGACGRSRVGASGSSGSAAPG